MRITILLSFTVFLISCRMEETQSYIHQRNFYQFDKPRVAVEWEPAKGVMFTCPPIIPKKLLSSCNNKSSKISVHSKYQGLDTMLNHWVEDGQIVGVELLILENNETVYHETYGWSNKESGTTLQKGSIWTVMSMTKPFTATAILMLMEDSLLSLSDPVNKYIPNFPASGTVTIHHLLAQSSGDDGSHGEGGYNVLEFETLNDWISDWTNQNSLGPVGKFAYSNFNYGALAYIMQKVTGMTIEAFIQKRIIQPLKLEQTYVFFAPDSLWAEKVPHRYEWNEAENKYEKFWSNKDPQAWDFFPGSLGLWMSAQNYATFLQMWINKGVFGGVRLLEECTVEEATKIQVNAYGVELFGHGYGWFIELEPLVFRYGGSAGGVGIGYPKENTVVIYLTHSSGRNHKSNFQDAMDKIWFPDDN